MLADLVRLPVIGRSLEQNDVPAQVQGWLETAPERMSSLDGLLGTAQIAASQAVGAVQTLLLLVLLLVEGPALVHSGQRMLPTAQLGGVVGGAALVLLALTAGSGSAVVALLAWLVYTQVENRVVQPVVVGRAVQLSPLTTMVVALLGVAVAGLLGAVLAVPLVAAVKGRP